MSVIEAIFNRRRAMIGMVHLPGLPGTPRGVAGVDEVVEWAVRDARTLAEAGFDGVLIENMGDLPYVIGDAIGPETTAYVTRAAVEVGRAVGLPMGVQILSCGNRQAIAAASAAGAAFVRCENYVFSHIADEGLLPTGQAGGMLRYRRQIGAESVAVWADIKKKHASHAITADVSLGEMAHSAEFFGADAVVVTGVATGRATNVKDVEEASGSCGLPVVVGSGVTPDQLEGLLGHAQGIIVGSWIKRDGKWENPVDAGRAREFVKEAGRVVANSK